jgi:lipopolysaccharide export LptBFGC system permease protein LptF
MKIFILATIGLTLILSLGSIIGTVHKYGVGPGQVGHIIFYFLPIILTFVLPMAALFAASLVFGRFASDNELDACKASGISLTSVIYPGVVLAVMVAIANLLLSFYVMPEFILRAEKTFKADAKQILFRNIQRKGYYKLPQSRFVIYADAVDTQNDILRSVIITGVKGGSIEKVIHAERAKIHFISHERFNKVEITAYNTYQMDPEDSAFIGKASFSHEIGALLADDIKFKKIREMKQIWADPMNFYPIEKLAGETYAQFTVELLAQDIKKVISAEPNSFYKLLCGEKVVEFTADNCIPNKDKKIELSGDVIVRDPTRDPPRTWTCRKAVISIEGDELAPTLTMLLVNPSWVKPDGIPEFTSRPRIYGLLVPAGAAPEELMPNEKITQSKTQNLLIAIGPDSTKALSKGPSSTLRNAQNELFTTINSTMNEIKAETHFRLVFGIGCILMIMIGIGLGIIKKDGHLLAAFGASCIPAAVLVVCIMMGKNIAKNPGAQFSGIDLMWMGLVILAFLAIVIYRKLLKN